MKFEPKDADYAQKVRLSFARQKVCALIGAELILVEPGKVNIKLPYRLDLTQQNDFIHAGIITAIADSSCGYAAYSLMPATKDVLSVEFKQNLLSPAIGDFFIAEARVVRPGNTLTVAKCNVYAFKSNEKKLISTMLATLISIENRELKS